MSQLGLGDLGPLQKGLDIFHLWVLGIKGTINAGGLIIMMGSMSSLAGQRPFSSSYLHPVMALSLSLHSPAARQLLPGLGDRPLGTVPPPGNEQG